MGCLNKGIFCLIFLVSCCTKGFHAASACGGKAYEQSFQTSIEPIRNNGSRR